MPLSLSKAIAFFDISCSLACPPSKESNSNANIWRKIFSSRFALTAQLDLQKLTWQVFSPLSLLPGTRTMKKAFMCIVLVVPSLPGNYFSVWVGQCHFWNWEHSTADFRNLDKSLEQTIFLSPHVFEKVVVYIFLAKIRIVQLSCQKTALHPV